MKTGNQKGGILLESVFTATCLLLLVFLTAGLLWSGLEARLQDYGAFLRERAKLRLPAAAFSSPPPPRLRLPLGEP